MLQRVAIGAGRIGVGKVGNDVLVAHQPAVTHLQGDQDALAEHGAERLTIRLLDDLSQDDIVRTVVVEDLARLADQGIAAELPKQIVAAVGRLIERQPGVPDGVLGLRADGLPFVLDIGDGVDIPQSRGVVEKLADRHLRRRFAAILGKIGADRPVEIQPLLLRELEDQRRGEQLGDRSGPIERPVRIRNIVRAVGEAEAALENYPTALLHQDRAAEAMFRGIASNEFPGRLPGLWPGERRNGRRLLRAGSLIERSEQADDHHQREKRRAHTISCCDTGGPARSG